MSLRRRFVLVLALYGATLSALLGFVAWRISRSALEDELDRRLTDVAGAAAATGLDANALTNLAEGYEDDPVYSAQRERLKGLIPFVDRAFVFSASRRTLIMTTEDTPPGKPVIGLPREDIGVWTDDISEAIATGFSTTRTFPWPDDDSERPYKYGFVRINEIVEAAGGDTLSFQVRPSDAMLGVLMPATFLEPIERLSTALLWTSIGGLVVAVILGSLLSTGVVAPLDQLSRSALRIQRGTLDRPIEAVEGARDEVASLARAMERMRQGIIERDDRLRLMLAQVAHELRNPLGGIELFASAASTSEDPTERRRLIARVRSEVSALNRIIDDFLTFARPLELDYEPVDLRSAIAEAVELGRAQVARGGSIELELPEDALNARADRDQVKRAVLNLVRNAVQSGTNVRVWGEPEGGEVMIAVLDDGPGIAEAIRDRIFDPFVTDKQAGAGLGLAIVKKVAEAHGGRVEVRQASDPAFGTGAEFRLYLRGFAAPATREIPVQVAASL
jgi:signal transduction histidine kinase